LRVFPLRNVCFSAARGVIFPSSSKKALVTLFPFSQQGDDTGTKPSPPSSPPSFFSRRRDTPPPSFLSPAGNWFFPFFFCGLWAGGVAPYPHLFFPQEGKRTIPFFDVRAALSPLVDVRFYPFLKEDFHVSSRPISLSLFFF